MPAPLRGAFEREPDHALAAGPREDRHLDPDLAGQTTMRATADPRVLALRVLADEEDVDVVRPATRERARDPRQQPAGSQVRPEVEPLAQLEDRAPERDVVGHRRVADRAEQHRLAPRELLRPVLRHHPPVLVVERRAPGQLDPVDAEAERVDGLAGLRDHLGAHAVPGEDGDAMAQAAAPTRPGTLST